MYTDKQICAFRGESIGMINVRDILTLIGYSKWDLGMYKVTVKNKGYVYVRVAELGQILFPPIRNIMKEFGNLLHSGGDNSKVDALKLLYKECSYGNVTESNFLGCMVVYYQLANHETRDIIYNRLKQETDELNS